MKRKIYDSSKHNKYNYLVGIVWAVGLGLLIFMPHIAMPYVSIISVIYFFYQFTPRKRGAKLVKRAKRSFNIGNHKGALHLLEGALFKKSSDIYIHYLMGASYHNLKKYKKAAQSLTKYIKDAEENHDALLILAHCHFQLKQYEEAIKITDQIPKSEKCSLRALIINAESHEKQGNIKQALERYESALIDTNKKSDDLDEIKAKHNALLKIAQTP